MRPWSSRKGITSGRMESAGSHPALEKDAAFGEGLPGVGFGHQAPAVVGTIHEEDTVDLRVLGFTGHGKERLVGDVLGLVRDPEQDVEGSHVAEEVPDRQVVGLPALTRSSKALSWVESRGR